MQLLCLNMITSTQTHAKQASAKIKTPKPKFGLTVNSINNSSNASKGTFSFESFIKAGAVSFSRNPMAVHDYVQAYSPAVDMWSVGVILFILLSGYSPFGTLFAFMSQSSILTADCPAMA